jgi:hypothetical protein
MHLTPGQTDKFRQLRIRQIAPATARVFNRTVSHGGGEGRAAVQVRAKAAFDAFEASVHAESRENLRKTWRIAIPGSKTEKVVKEVHGCLSGPDDSGHDVRSLLEWIEEAGMSLFFFSVKGISCYRFLLCANLSYYGPRPEEFYRALDEFCGTNRDMFCDPATYRPITDRNELAGILTQLTEKDMQTFSWAMAGVLSGGPCFTGIEFVGYDRRELEL